MHHPEPAECRQLQCRPDRVDPKTGAQQVHLETLARGEDTRNPDPLGAGATMRPPGKNPCRQQTVRPLPMIASPAADECKPYA
jgi:hypothetical protein